MEEELTRAAGKTASTTKKTTSSTAKKPSSAAAKKTSSATAKKPSSATARKPASTAAKKPAGTASTAKKKPASAAKTTAELRLNATEKKMIQNYRKCDALTKKIVVKVLEKASDGLDLQDLISLFR